MTSKSWIMNDSVHPEPAETTSSDRYIGRINGSSPGPTMIYMGGVHGNEPSGVIALQNVLDHLQETGTPVSGNIIALRGNIPALNEGTRYSSDDLNRLWTRDAISKIDSKDPSELNDDEQQQREIHEEIKTILSEGEGPFYFLDLHTTSAPTVPFMTVNDSLLNRNFAMQVPTPMILGIEEYLDGPLLSYINELGYVAFGFEAGQHDDPRSVAYHEAFIYLTLYFAGCVKLHDEMFNQQFDILHNASTDPHKIFEIYFRYPLRAEDSFTMVPGFENFQKIRKGEKMADHNGREVYADRDGNIFMPLYQDQGSDGFFAVRRIPKIFLNLSARLRKLRFDKLLPILPGIRWESDQHDTLIVDRRVARFFAKQFFHLLGYRSRRLDKTHLRIRNREAASRTTDYLDCAWYRGK
jgi:predicted deacylase